jgi:hypothetical protein
MALVLVVCSRGPSRYAGMGAVGKFYFCSMPHIETVSGDGKLPNA